MGTYNNLWDSLMLQAGSNVDVLSDLDTLREISNVMRINTAVCTSVGTFYLSQLGRIFLDMLGLYRALSSVINDAIVQGGVVVTRTPKLKALRGIKKDILKLVKTFLQATKDLDAVNASLIPPLLEAVLGDYSNNLPEAREWEVLTLMSTVAASLQVSRIADLEVSTKYRTQQHFTPNVSASLDAVFEPTLLMINKDFIEFPEHRLAFYDLLRAINKHCFSGMLFFLQVSQRLISLLAILAIPAPQFRVFMDSVIWAIKHTMRDVSTLGLNCMSVLLSDFLSLTIFPQCARRSSRISLANL